MLPVEVFLCCVWVERSKQPIIVKQINRNFERVSAEQDRTIRSASWALQPGDENRFSARSIPFSRTGLPVGASTGRSTDHLPGQYHEPPDRESSKFLLGQEAQPCGKYFLSAWRKAETGRLKMTQNSKRRKNRHALTNFSAPVLAEVRRESRPTTDQMRESAERMPVTARKGTLAAGNSF